MRSDHPSRSITEIAYDLGFSNSSQFLRAFRSRFAMTPSEAGREVLRLRSPTRGFSICAPALPNK
ncbi:MAG: helix-turn-helix domain-containing protein [Afipia sp.]|nr:helix-turn-helix domain-containing protein [Afipia sp.]